LLQLIPVCQQKQLPREDPMLFNRVFVRSGIIRLLQEKD
jgi:hypothetical protein